MQHCRALGPGNLYRPPPPRLVGTDCKLPRQRIISVTKCCFKTCHTIYNLNWGKVPSTQLTWSKTSQAEHTLRCYTLFLWHDFVSSATHAASQHMLCHSNNSNTDVRGAACIKNKNRFAVECLRKGVDNFWAWCAGRAWVGRKWTNNNLSVHQAYFDDKFKEDNMVRACCTLWS